MYIVIAHEIWNIRLEAYVWYTWMKYAHIAMCATIMGRDNHR